MKSYTAKSLRKTDEDMSHKGIEPDDRHRRPISPIFALATAPPIHSLPICNQLMQ